MAKLQLPLLEADCYVSFSYRDTCPNVIIEAMAHGLPILGLASGGIPDIVRDAGCLLPCDEFDGGFFCSHRFDNDFPDIDFSAMALSLRELLVCLPELRKKGTTTF